MRRIIPLICVAAALAGCDSSKWLEPPIPPILTCEELNKDPANAKIAIDMFAKTACLQAQKNWTGEFRCEGERKLQVECK